MQPKTENFNYIYTSSHPSNIDHLVTSIDFPISVITIISNYQLLDHLPIAASFKLHLTYTPINQDTPKAKWFPKMDWDKIHLLLYQEVLDSILQNIHIPFKLLRTS